MIMKERAKPPQSCGVPHRPVRPALLHDRGGFPVFLHIEPAAIMEGQARPGQLADDQPTLRKTSLVTHFGFGRVSPV
jgi:hypothetical protein